MVDIVNESGNLISSGRELELITSSLGGHAAQLEISSLEVSFVLVGSRDETFVEKSLHESSGMLVVVNGEVHQDDGGMAGGVWGGSRLIIALSHVLRHVRGSVLVPGAVDGVLGLILNFTCATTVVTSLVPVVFVIFIPNTHWVSGTSTEITFGQIARLGVHRLIIGGVRDSISLHGTLDGRLDEGLVLQFFVNVCKQLLILFASFSLINLIADFLGFLGLLFGDLHFHFLLVEGANSNILIVVEIFIRRRLLGLDVTYIIPLARTGSNLIVLGSESNH